MQQIHTRPVALMSQGRLVVETHTAIVSLKDLNLGDDKGKRIDQPIDIGFPRPTCFRHESGDIEVLNGELVSECTNKIHPEQEVYFDVIDITSLTAEQVPVVRFWHGDRAWCSFHKKSRFDDKIPSWKDVISTIMESPNLENALALELFNKNKLELNDERALCSKQISKASISDYKKKIKKSLAA